MIESIVKTILVCIIFYSAYSILFLPKWTKTRIDDDNSDIANKK